MKIFTVVCHGNAKGLLDVTAETGARCSCLYNEPVDPGVYQAAPFLVEVNEEIKPWFASLTDSWGLYLITGKDVSFHEMRQHLRKFTYVKIPTEEVPVLFRFYDPRFFWRLTEVIEDIDLQRFLGPIELVASNYLKFKQAHFDDRKVLNVRRFSDGYLSFSERQFEKLNGFYREDYIDKLSAYIIDEVDWESIALEINEKYEAEYAHYKMLKHQKDIGREITHPLDIELLSKKSFFEEQYRGIVDKEGLTRDLASDIFYFLKELGINDERSIKTFSLIVLKLKIIRFDDIPSSILDFFKKSQKPKSEIVKSLLDKVIGAKQGAEIQV